MNMSVAPVRTKQYGEMLVTRTRGGKLIAYKVHGGSTWVSEEIAVETLDRRVCMQIRIDHGIRRHRSLRRTLFRRLR